MEIIKGGQMKGDKVAADHEGRQIKGAAGQPHDHLAFFLLNMLWSRHVKPSPAKGEKRKKRN